ncbi:ParB-like chromosome segregation protein Spo0J [Bradyrhizobium sp. RT9a]
MKQKRLAKAASVPCVVRDPATDILGEDDSLTENIQRAPLHPLDQFRAFQAPREKGRGEEDIAAAFFIPVNVAKQRLRFASVSPALLEVYADDGMSLEQLMAFTVTPDHGRVMSASAPAMSTFWISRCIRIAHLEKTFFEKTFCKIPRAVERH